MLTCRTPGTIGEMRNNEGMWLNRTFPIAVDKFATLALHNAAVAKATENGSSFRQSRSGATHGIASWPNRNVR